MMVCLAVEDMVELLVDNDFGCVCTWIWSYIQREHSSSHISQQGCPAMTSVEKRINGHYFHTILSNR